MYVWSSLRPRSYLHHRTLAVAAGRLYVFWLPYITELSAFDATVSSPSSIPFVGWAVDAFMVFVGGWLLLFACARLLLQVPCMPVLPARPVQTSAPGMLPLQWPPSECCPGLVPLLALQPAAPG